MLGIGCNSVDYVYRLPAAPVAGTATAKLRIASHAVSCGGQTATAMAACAALGLRTAYLGVVGSDDHGRRMRDELARRGVDVSPLLTRECPSRFAVIAVDASTGERLVLWDRDDRLALAPREIPDALVRAARVVHVDDEDQEAAIAAAAMARAAGVPVTSDIERLTTRTADLVAAVSVPIFNEHLLPALTGEADPERALRALRRTHDGRLCVTLGPRGALLLDGDELIHEPGFAVTAVDTTAAGDIFRAGLIHGLLAKAAPRAMLRFANAAAALGCTRDGAMASVPAFDEVAALVSAA